jgi:hypothetical protein
MPHAGLVEEIADGIYLISARRSAVGGRPVHQLLVLADEPLLFHTGPRAECLSISGAVDRVVPLERLRWLVFGDLGANERGRVDPLTGRLPHLRPVVGPVGCLDLGGRRLRRVAMPFAPHHRETQVLFEEVTRTLLGGDLDAELGVDPSLDAEPARRHHWRDPGVPLALRRLADLEPRTLAVLHGSSLTGDGGGFLRSLASRWAHPSLHPTNHNQMKEHVS